MILTSSWNLISEELGVINMKDTFNLSSDRHLTDKERSLVSPKLSAILGADIKQMMEGEIISGTKSSFKSPTSQEW